MTDEHGAWQTYGERTIYDNKWVRLGLADVQAPNGERWQCHVVHLARIAIALIVDERDEALMLWRYRFTTDQWGTSCSAAWSRTARSLPLPLLVRLPRRVVGGRWAKVST